MSARPAYLSLCPAEPFRIFFPLATLLGISGVSLWPLFFTGLHKFYPGVMHSRLMIEGFLAGFVIGFLGTAMPRLLAAPVLRAWELWTLVALYLTTAGLHIGHQMIAGDVVFVVLLALFAAFLIRRVRARTELPPPGFVLVALGYASGLSGAALWAGGVKGWVPGNFAMLGGMWLNQAFVLLLVLGVGTFLLPRFLALPGVVLMADERRASPEWLRRAAFSLVVGITVLASYWIEVAHAALTTAAILRGVVVLAYLAVMVPIYRTPSPTQTVPLAVNLALIALVAGLAFPLFWPGQRAAGLHVIFLGGFSLITFTVATRVVLGHSGNEHLFLTRLPPLRIATLLLVAGTVVRAVADFLPDRTLGMNWASTLWMLAACVWGYAVLPKVRIADPTGETACARRRALTPAT
ncbi:MAG: NnrS family protein [Chthoniobacteraceae bacterium]